MDKTKEIERSIIKKYRKTIWTRFIKAIKDYELVKVADVDIYKLDSNYDDFKYSVKNIKIDKSVEELKESAITESTLKTKDRNRLDDSEFGLPELRKYPLNDREHVLAAIRFFNRCPYGYEEELARRIKRKMKEFKISSSIVGHKNNLTRYL